MIGILRVRVWDVDMKKRRLRSLFKLKSITEKLLDVQYEKRTLISYQYIEGEEQPVHQSLIIMHWPKPFL